MCPVECHMKKQCAHCITTPGCGWCALGQVNGLGLCMWGGLVGPTTGSCREGNIRSDTGHQRDQFGERGREGAGIVWEPIRKRAHAQLVREHSDTVVSAR